MKRFESLFAIPIGWLILGLSIVVFTTAIPGIALKTGMNFRINSAVTSTLSLLGAHTATPTHTPMPSATLTPTRTRRSPTPVPTRATARRSPTRVPTRNVAYVTVRIQANVRSGPGTNYDIVGSLDQGDRVSPIAQNGDGQWLQLEVGRWLFVALVNSVPPNLPIARNIPIPPTPSVDGPHAGKDANLRAGPGTTFAVIGFLKRDDRVVPIGRSPDNQWLKLENGAWIFAELVNNVPSVPVVDLSATTPVPVATRGPATVDDHVPYRSNTANVAIPRADFDRPFNTPNGLAIALTSIIGSDSPQLAKFIALPPGARCKGCLVVSLAIENLNGNLQEDVIQEDFELIRGSPYDPHRETVEQFTCDDIDALRTPREGTSLKPIPQRLGVFTRTLCFRNAPAPFSVVRREFQLAYRIAPKIEYIFHYDWVVLFDLQ